MSTIRMEREDGLSRDFADVIRRQLIAGWFDLAGEDTDE